MNNTKFMQTDSRWGGLVYPIKPCYIRNVGCGEVSVANIIIEMQQEKRSAFFPRLYLIASNLVRQTAMGRISQAFQR